MLKIAASLDYYSQRYRVSNFQNAILRNLHLKINAKHFTQLPSIFRQNTASTTMILMEAKALGSPLVGHSVSLIAKEPNKEGRPINARDQRGEKTYF